MRGASRLALHSNIGARTVKRGATFVVRRGWLALADGDQRGALGGGHEESARGFNFQSAAADTPAGLAGLCCERLRRTGLRSTPFARYC